MENTGKHTKGKWKLIGNKVVKEDNNYNGIALVLVQKNYKDITFEPIPDVEAEANAQIIVEAGNVMNETGLTPRQLLEERNEMLDFINEFKYWKEKDLRDLSLIELQILKQANEIVIKTMPF